MPVFQLSHTFIQDLRVMYVLLRELFPHLGQLLAAELKLTVHLLVQEALDDLPELDVRLEELTTIVVSY